MEPPFLLTQSGFWRIVPVSRKCIVYLDLEGGEEVLRLGMLFSRAFRPISPSPALLSRAQSVFLEYGQYFASFVLLLILDAINVGKLGAVLGVLEEHLDTLAHLDVNIRGREQEDMDRTLLVFERINKEILNREVKQ